MDIFDNCRICLREINHEPIKMTRLILRFLENCLQLTNVTKPNRQDNVKQNLCAPCFNRLSEFQDFHEQCKDSDEFWKTQFEDTIKEVTPEKQLTFEQTVLLPLAEDSNSLEADTTVSTSEEKTSTVLHHQHQVTEVEQTNANILTVSTENKEPELELNHENETNILPAPSPMEEVEEEDEEEADDDATAIEDFNSIDLTNWPDDTNDDDVDADDDEPEDIQIIGQNNCETANNKTVDQQIIEYEYHVEEDEEVEIEEMPAVDEPTASAESLEVDYRSFAYEKIETENSSEGAATIIDETIEETMEEHSETTTQNAFFMTTVIDENGKVKMSYKCQHCGKLNKFYFIKNIILTFSKISLL